jgi:hypothetical protein
MLAGMFLTVGPAAIGAGSVGALVVGFTFIRTVVALSIASFVGWGILIFILLTVFIVFIINTGAYVVPIQFERGLTGVTPPDCLGTPPPIPNAEPLKLSSDGNYAFPVGQFQVPGYSYYHWDGNKAADIFSPLQRPPIVAPENGTIASTVLNDSLGGKYIIFHGVSGKYYYFAHLCHIYVNSGSAGVGQVIATMDETGNGRVQHLHYAINENSDFFYGGDGNICPQSDFEEKFDFGICTDSLAISILTGKPRCCIK